MRFVRRIATTVAASALIVGGLSVAHATSAFALPPSHITATGYGTGPTILAAEDNAEYLIQVREQRWYGCIFDGVVLSEQQNSDGSWTVLISEECDAA
jgi:hypothetical protein